MIDLAHRIDAVTNRVRMEAARRMLGRPSDERFDFALDVLLDLDDELSADLPTGRDPAPTDTAEGVSGAGVPGCGASDPTVEWPGSP